MSMVFEKFSPSPSMVFGGINYWQRWFFDGFPILRDQWSTMVTEEEKRVFWDNLQENWNAKSSMTLKYFTTNSHSWHTHIIFQVCNPKTFYQPIFWKLLLVFLLQLDRKKQKFTYNCQKSMVLRITIAIDGMVSAQPLVPMVFQWFFRQSTIGDDGFRWLPTIGPTMRW